MKIEMIDDLELELEEEEIEDDTYEQTFPNFTPYDIQDNDGHYHCPFEDYGGGDRCRVCCGLGVDE